MSPGAEDKTTVQSSQKNTPAPTPKASDGETTKHALADASHSDVSRPATSVTPGDLAEALARLEFLTGRLLGLEREVVDLQAFRRRVQEEIGRARGPEASSAASADQQQETARLRAENDRLRRELDEAPAGPAAPDREPELKALRAEVEGLRAKANGSEEAARDLQAARDEGKRLLSANERLEGEFQALKLRHDELKTRTEAAAGKIGDLSVDFKDATKVEEAFKALVVERERLRDEKTGLEAELMRIKSEATKRFTKLKSELDKAMQDSATTRMQKENLLQQLMARDAESGGQSVKRELTREEITNSEVFKSMLGNIRRTSRQEVTVLHDSIAQMRTLDPNAYALALELIAKGFQKASMENPLATLPKT